MHPTVGRKSIPAKWLIVPAVFLLFNTGFLYSQEDPTYPASIEEKIKQVENNLAGKIRIEGESAWNLQQRAIPESAEPGNDQVATDAFPGK